MALSSFDLSRAKRYRTVAKRINQRLVRLERLDYFGNDFTKSPTYQQASRVISPVQRGSKLRLPESIKNITPEQLTELESAAQRAAAIVPTTSKFKDVKSIVESRFRQFDTELSQRDIGDFFQLVNSDFSEIARMLGSAQVVQLVKEAGQSNVSLKDAIQTYASMHPDYTIQDLNNYLFTLVRGL